MPCLSRASSFKFKLPLAVARILLANHGARNDDLTPPSDASADMDAGHGDVRERPVTRTPSLGRARRQPRAARELSASRNFGRSAAGTESDHVVAGPPALVGNQLTATGLMCAQCGSSASLGFRVLCVQRLRAINILFA